MPAEAIVAEDERREAAERPGPPRPRTPRRPPEEEGGRPKWEGSRRGPRGPRRTGGGSWEGDRPRRGGAPNGNRAMPEREPPARNGNRWPAPGISDRTGRGYAGSDGVYVFPPGQGPVPRILKGTPYGWTTLVPLTGHPEVPDDEGAEGRTENAAQGAGGTAGSETAERTAAPA